MKKRLGLGLVLLVIMISEALAGHPCAHVLICCRGAGRGVTFEVNGKFIANHCYGEEYSIYGSYDDACDSIFWGIADTTHAAKQCSIYPDASNPRYYYDVLKRVLKEDAPAEENVRLDGDALLEQWQDPPLAYRLNLNLHNFPLEAVEQDELIKQTLADGWGGYALNVPYQHYLTDEGMDETTRFVKKAKSEGMDLWLYDEQGYPSGNAGDRVINENPAWECMGIFFNHTMVMGGDVTFEIPPGKPILVVAFPVTDGQADYSNQRDLRENLDGSLLKWRVPAGEWLIFAATKHTLYEGFQAADKGGSKLGSRYPSLLIPEVTEAFIRSTHDVYAEYLGDDLGQYFTSTFTDEPSLMAMQFHRYPDQHALIPWQEVLSEEIEKRYGYRPEEKLVAFYFDEGSVGQKYRYQYFKTVGDLFAQNFFGRIRDWCEQHQLKSGGHLLLEETLIAHVPLYGHIMQCFRAMHAPGIDILSCYPENMPVHSPKLAASAAALAGHHLVMSEPCPAADRTVKGEPTFAPARGHFNLLLQGGVTHFNSYLRLKKLDRAQQNELNTYVGRVGMLLRGGHTLSDIGIVYPIESLWTRFTPRYHKVVGWNAVTGATDIVRTIEKTFQDVSRFMFEQRWEYTHLDGQALMEGTPTNGTFVHDPFRFKVIILPYVNTLPAQAWANLQAYIEQGGKVICLGEMPLNSDRQFPDETLRSSFAELVQKKDHVVFMETWDTATLNAQLNTWLKKPLHIEEESEPLRMTHKHINGKELFFVINDSDKTLKTEVCFRTSKPLAEWDPTTGRVRSISNPASIVLMPYEGKIYREN